MQRAIKILISGILIALIISVIFYFQKPISLELGSFLNKLNYVVQTEIANLSPPCQKPIYYSLGNIDPRFNVSRAELLSALQSAGDIWSKPINLELFASSTDGALKINMVYDYRQEATDKLKKLGIFVTNDQKSYADLKAKYDALSLQYAAKKDLLDSQVADLKARQAAYEAEVEKWNRQGGAPAKEYERLNNLRVTLNAQVDAVNQLSAQVNAIVDNLNAEGTVLNKLIEQLNLNVQKYNNVGAQTGEEFQEGVYAQGQNGTAITVFEFSDRNQLVRLLAHEMGHALGLEHTSGQSDIMYYLNNAENNRLEANDLSAIKAKCALK